jgi:hypothetical protein
MDARMKHDDLLAIARDRREDAENADKGNREEAKHDLRFAVGKGQWDDDIRAARELEGKPCLTINGMPKFIRQVTGQIRKMNPAIKVVPADGMANEDIAEVYEGLVRQIEYQSDASSVYEQAAESAAACGIGHFRLRAKYCEGYTFNQELVVERIHNPFAVLWDASAKQPTRSDAGYCFILEDMPTDDFKEAYPDARAEAVTSEHKDGGSLGWYSKEAVTIAEYFWVEQEKVKIGQLRDGSIVKDPVAPMDVIKTRTVDVPRVKWAKITGSEVLEGPTDIPGPFIPVFAVTGEEWHLGEEMYRSSVIRFAKDAQQLYNYARSMHAEVVGLQPKAPYLVTPKQIAGLEEFWQAANASNSPYLPYNPDEKAGAPQRMQPPVSPSGIVAELQISSDDMKNTTGIYDASLGARSNETSGVAIQERQQEAQMSTSVYADNMVKAIHQCGRVMVAQIPFIYDTERIIHVLGEDDNEKAVTINKVVSEAFGYSMENNLTMGKYEARIGVGPSYDTLREAASDGMIAFISAYPQAALVTADLVAKAQSWPDADKFAARLRKALPPGVIDAEDLPEDEQQQLMQGQQQAQQMQQMQQQVQQMQLQLAMADAQAKVKKTEADTAKSVAQTAETQMDTADKQFELADKTGQLNAIIEQQVMRALTGIMAQQRAPQPYGQTGPL